MYYIYIIYVYIYIYNICTYNITRNQCCVYVLRNDRKTGNTSLFDEFSYSFNT